MWLTVQPRAFDPWPSGVPPCFPPDGVMTPKRVKVPHNESVSEGLFFLKTFKTGSSTSAGVNLRIARNEARRQDKDYHFCKARFDHGKPWKHHGATLFGNRRPRHSFLWAIIRDPTKRAVSQFFHFKVGRQKVSPTDANFIQAMRADKSKYYIQSLSLQNFSEHDTMEAANQIIQDYNFIGITERIDESFVVLSMLLGVPLGDVLYLSAKLNGTLDAQCKLIPTSQVSPVMKEFFASRDWADTIQEDLALYRAVYRSLDLTIERLGRSKFEAMLATYRFALQMAQDRCNSNPQEAVFPCRPDGKRNKKTDCLWKDSGCGATCLDQVASDLGIDRL